MLKQASEGSISLPAQVCKIVETKSVISKLTFLPPTLFCHFTVILKD